MDRGGQSLEQQIKDFLCQTLLLDARDVEEAASLSEAGLVDSVGVVELVAFVEKTFNMHVSQADVIPEHFDSIPGLLRFIQARVPLDGDHHNVGSDAA